jgi:hypothetical protein
MSDEQRQMPSGEALELADYPKSKTGALSVGQNGLQLSNLDDAWRFCNAMASSGMMPKGMETAQKILYALELGFEVGLPPLAAVQSIAVINGRASLYGDVMLGLCVASDKFDDDAFEEDWIRDDKQAVIGAYCVAGRLKNGKPTGKPRRWDFTIEDAKTARLWGKEGPWQTAPKRMLQMRARAFALRDVFPDVLKGIISREEARDIPPEKNVTEKSTVTRPTNLSELTEQLTAEPIETTATDAAKTAASAEQATVAESPVPEKIEPTEKAAKKTTKAEAPAKATPVASAEPKAETAAPNHPTPPPKPTATVTETAAPKASGEIDYSQEVADEVTPPEGGKKFRKFIWLAEEINATDETRHSASELAAAMVEVKRTGINLDKWCTQRLGCDPSKLTSAGMNKITTMLKNVG